MTTARPNSSGSLFTIFMIVFLDLVGFGIVIPILPYYAAQYGANGFTIGWLMTSYSLMQFLVAPIWGKISDQKGRRPVLLISVLGSAVAMTLLGFASSLEWLFIGRIFAGICGANISTAYAYIADTTTEENRSKGMGMVGAAFGLGFIFGPAIGSTLARYGFAAPMFAAAALSVLNFILAVIFLKEPEVAPETRASHRTHLFRVSTLKTAFESPRSRLGIFLFFLLTVSVTQMEVVFAIFMKAKYALDVRHAGYLLALMGIIMVLVQGGLIRPLSKRFSELSLITWGSAICALGLWIFGYSDLFQSTVAGLVILGLGHGMLHPSLSSLTSKGANPTQRGVTMGVFHSAGSLSRVVGPPTAGWLYDHVSQNAPLASEPSF